MSSLMRTVQGLVLGSTLLGCGESVAGTVNDREDPAAQITSPAAGDITGPITIVVSATDNVGVVAVILILNGATFAQDNSAPFEFAFDPTAFGPGTYTVRARAVDAVGNSFTTPNVDYVYFP